MERSLSQCDLHRYAVRSTAPSRRGHRCRGRQLSGPRERAGNRSAPEEEVNRVGVGDAIYVVAVLMLYTDLPDTPLRPSQVDQSVARKLHQEAVSLALVESALLLATL